MLSTYQLEDHILETEAELQGPDTCQHRLKNCMVLRMKYDKSKEKGDEYPPPG